MSRETELSDIGRAVCRSDIFSGWQHFLQSWLNHVFIQKYEIDRTKIRNGRLLHIKDRSSCPSCAPDRTGKSGDSPENDIVMAAVYFALTLGIWTVERQEFGNGLSLIMI